LFDDTISKYRDEIGPISLLRLDGDWYKSIKCCLDELAAQVVPGGVIILDDYYAWEGCARATHDYLAEIKSPLRIREGEGGGTAYLRC